MGLLAHAGAFLVCAPNTTAQVDMGIPLMYSSNMSDPACTVTLTNTTADLETAIAAALNVALGIHTSPWMSPLWFYRATQPSMSGCAGQDGCMTLDFTWAVGFALTGVFVGIVCFALSLSKNKLPALHPNKKDGTAPP